MIASGETDINLGGENKTFDPDDDIEVTYEDQSEAQFVRIRVYDRVLN